MANYDVEVYDRCHSSRDGSAPEFCKFDQVSEEERISRDNFNTPMFFFAKMFLER